MDYPDRLLPRPNFRVISEATALSAYFLQRGTPDGEIIDPVTGKIKPSCISFQSGHLHDLSTNLIGTFLPEDQYLQIIGDRKDHYTRELWPAGEEVATPIFEIDFIKDDSKGSIYFLIGKLENLSIPYNVGEDDGFTAVCKIIHTPVRANFWHFSLRWFNEEGDVLLQKGSWKKRMLTSARAALVEFGQLARPETAPVPNSYYTV